MNELKRCPFCGSEAEFYNDGRCSQAWFVRCKGCGIHTKSEMEGHGNDVFGKLTAVWNHRPYRSIECVPYELEGDDGGYEWLPDDIRDFDDCADALEYMDDMNSRAEGGRGVAFMVGLHRHGEWW